MKECSSQSFDNVIIQVYKILNEIDQAEKEKLFTQAQYTATRGHAFKLHKRRSRLNIQANTFSNHVVNSRNGLLDTVVNTLSVNSFKGRLSKHLHRHPSKFEATCYQPSRKTRDFRQNRQEAPFRGNQLVWCRV